MKVRGERNENGGLEPRHTMERLREANTRMVMSCNIKKERHSLYAKDYNPSNQTYQCINSWGGNMSEPTIGKKDVYGLFYINIADCDKKIL